MQPMQMKIESAPKIELIPEGRDRSIFLEEMPNALFADLYNKK